MTTLVKITTAKEFDIFKIEDFDKELKAKYISNPMSCGFPSPAADYEEEQIDLKKILFKNINTYILKAKGNSMQEANIFTGDLIIVDTSKEPKNKDICVCVVDGDYTLKCINKSEGKLFLMPFNKNLKPIEVTELNRFSIWGVLTFSIHKHHKGI